MARCDWIRLLVAVWLMAGVWACDAPPTTLGPELVRQLAGIPYPKDAAIEDLDIVVVQEKGEIILTNRTAASYPRTHLWINQQYVGLLEEIPIGSAIRFQLVDFINEYGESFPVGGILKPDKTETVVLAELYTTEDPLRADSTETRGGGGGSARYRLLRRPYHK